MTTRPTPNQLAALREIAAGRVTMRNGGSAAFRIFAGELHSSVIGRCVSLGWARWPKGVVGDQTCEITEAGTATLAATAGQE